MCSRSWPRDTGSNIFYSQELCPRHAFYCSWDVCNNISLLECRENWNWGIDSSGVVEEERHNFKGSTVIYKLKDWSSGKDSKIAVG